jgi:hypothetical protein
MLLIPFLIWLITGTGVFERFFPPAVLFVSIVNLAVGNSCMIYVSMLAVAKRKNYWLLPHAITAPAYWFLQSVAAYKALYQLIARPFYWEKTVHGISKYTASELLRAGSTG